MDKISTSCLYSGNAWFIEDLYEAWLANPASIAPEWRQYFDTLSKNDPDPGKDIAHSPIQRAFLESARQTTSAAKDLR